MRLHKPFVFAIFALCASAAHAQLSLGGLIFNNNQFGNTLTESDGGTFSSWNWMNVANTNPGNPGFLTGANFDTGIANIDANAIYTIGYDTPIVNGVGDDFGVVVARFSADDFFLSMSYDGVNFGPAVMVFSATAVATGVGKAYFYQNSPFNCELFVHSLDLSDFGVLSGKSVKAIRVTNKSELDLVRIAGMNENAVPEPASFIALASGALILIRRTRT